MRCAAFNSGFHIFVRQAVTRADDHSDRPVLKVACILHIGTMRIIRNSLKCGIDLNLIKNMLRMEGPQSVMRRTTGKNRVSLACGSVQEGEAGSGVWWRRIGKRLS